MVQQSSFSVISDGMSCTTRLASLDALEVFIYEAASAGEDETGLFDLAANEVDD